ncbi:MULTISPECIES: DUF6445 family protein [unclassified Janthinobacterium]|jgi:hypothetical protein|uniref:DUF6445 family protein n=1 Tax=unclassified Janthinobacterium TaxID=2610881 RepID=UPI001E5D2BD9|nr:MULTISPECIES: DUF6445 family protein [unclassified Janthinobacterium]MCC7644704.1 hypothetical protein [Janthinobacterium sp. EB271-G4-3-1]MCC7691786.1 hypothetical protein [Janthinobacterium sp. EB271-G4-3-2]
MGEQTLAEQHLANGQRLQQAGKLIEAINAYQAAYQLNPALAEAQHFQGLAMLELGQGAIGLGLLKLSLKQQPDNALFHYNLGNVLRGTDSEAALASYATAARLAPHEHDFAISHAELLMGKQRLTDTIAELERAHALRPQRWQTLQGLAELYYRTGQQELALQRYAQGLALHAPLAQTCRIGFASPGTDNTERLTAPDVPASLHDFLRETDLHILDDFLPDPAAWRAQALALPFEQQRYAGQNYPGSQTAGQPSQAIMERIATALGRPIRFISPDNGSYRLSYADAMARTDIHVDNETGNNFNFYAGVLYLNPPEQCQGGTTFWRHQPSGWYRRLPEADVKAGGYASFKDFQKRWLPNSKVQKFNELQEQRDSWQALLEVPMRHNRLIVYKGHYFHSISNVFGDTPENGRLVQLFFFEVPD